MGFESQLGSESRVGGTAMKGKGPRGDNGQGPDVPASVCAEVDHEAPELATAWLPFLLEFRCLNVPVLMGK
jgi:hypothetical protein